MVISETLSGTIKVSMEPLRPKVSVVLAPETLVEYAAEAGIGTRLARANASKAARAARRGKNRYFLAPKTDILGASSRLDSY
jgi:hypothetical protein